MYEIAYGKKYDKSLDVTDIAVLVRKDVKDGIKKGELPAALKVSVRVSRYSMGRSISIEVKEVPEGFTIRNPERIKFEESDPNWIRRASEFPIQTAEASALQDKLEAILAAYNYDGSDLMTDYYNVNFAGSVTWHSKLTKRDRERVMAQVRGEPEPEPREFNAETVLVYMARWKGTAASSVAYEFDVSTNKAKKLLASMAGEGLILEGYSRHRRVPLYRVNKTECKDPVGEARKLGKAAFERGDSSVPAHDPELTKLLKGNGVLPVLEAWTEAWHQANVAAPVPELESEPMCGEVLTALNL